MHRSKMTQQTCYGHYSQNRSEKVTDKTIIPPPDWEALIAQIADDIMAERSPARILEVRAKLYDLLSHCIPPTTILKVTPIGTLLSSCC